MIGNRGSHGLDDVIDLVKPGVNDCLAEGLKPRNIERDVVVDDEDTACAAHPRVTDILDDAIKVVRVKVPSTHLDDRAETAVERAAARRLDNVDLPAEHSVSVKDSRGALG